MDRSNRGNWTEKTHITHKATDKGLVCKSLICFEYCNKKKALSERKTERVRDGVRLWRGMLWHDVFCVRAWDNSAGVLRWIDGWINTGTHVFRTRWPWSPHQVRSPSGSIRLRTVGIIMAHHHPPFQEGLFLQPIGFQPQTFTQQPKQKLSELFYMVVPLDCLFPTYFRNFFKLWFRQT